MKISSITFALLGLTALAVASEQNTAEAALAELIEEDSDEVDIVDNAWDAFTSPIADAFAPIGDLPWGVVGGAFEVAGNAIGNWVEDAFNYFSNLATQLVEFIAWLFTNPCELDGGDFASSIGNSFNVAKIGSITDMAKGDPEDAIAGAACTAIWGVAELFFPVLNIIMAIIGTLVTKCKVFGSADPTFSVSLKAEFAVESAYQMTASGEFYMGVGISSSGKKVCKAGIAYSYGIKFPTLGGVSMGVGISLTLSIGAPGTGWCNFLFFGADFSASFVGVPGGFGGNICYYYDKQFTKFGALGTSITLNSASSTVIESPFSISFTTGKAYTFACYMAGSFEGKTCAEGY